jgi:hypothetical protein
MPGIPGMALVVLAGLDGVEVGVLVGVRPVVEGGGVVVVGEGDAEVSCMGMGGLLISAS